MSWHCPLWDWMLGSGSRGMGLKLRLQSWVLLQDVSDFQLHFNARSAFALVTFPTQITTGAVCPLVPPAQLVIRHLNDASVGNKCFCLQTLGVKGEAGFYKLLSVYKASHGSCTGCHPLHLQTEGSPNVRQLIPSSTAIDIRRCSGTAQRCICFALQWDPSRGARATMHVNTAVMPFIRIASSSPQDPPALQCDRSAEAHHRSPPCIPGVGIGTLNLPPRPVLFVVRYCVLAMIQAHLGTWV